MRIFAAILLLCSVHLCLFGQTINQRNKSSGTVDSIAKANSGEDILIKDLRDRIKNLEIEKNSNDNFKFLEGEVLVIKEKLQNMYYIFAIAILVATLGASLITIFTFNKKIKNLKNEIKSLKGEKKTEANFTTGKIIGDAPENYVEIYDNTSKYNTPSNPEDRDNFEVVGVKTDFQNTHKTFFGGPEGVLFLFEYEHSTTIADKSLFEFIIEESNPLEATFSVLANPYSVKTIMNNKVAFESVCDFLEFSYNAQFIDTVKIGKASRTQKGWKVTDKTKVKLV